MNHITRCVAVAGALLAVGSPAAAQDPQWVRDVEAQVEASANAIAQTVAAQVPAIAAAASAAAMPQFDKSRLKAQRDRAKARARDAVGGPEYTEAVSKTVRLGANGTLDLTTIAGDVTITAAGSDAVKIDATKRVRGTNEADARALMKQLEVQIDERPGLIEVRTQFPRRTSFPFVTVDYNVTVPAGTSLTLKTVSGNVQITGVKGDVSANTVSGDVTLRSLKSRALDVETVSGNLRLAPVDIDRVQLRTINGDIDYSGKLARSGRYDMQSHSGDIRIAAPESPGFDIEASTFSGDISSDYPVTLRGGAGNSLVSRGPGRTVRGSFGDASAVLTLRSFSGDISITKK